MNLEEKKNNSSDKNNRKYSIIKIYNKKIKGNKILLFEVKKINKYS
jgi:hypothetical protein